MAHLKTPTADIALDTAEKIAEGNDSHVYLCGGDVYKEYLRLSFEQVDRYASLVNEAVAVIERLGYGGHIRVDGVGYDLHFKGLAARAVGVGPRGRALIRSEFIPHPNLDKLTQRPEHFAKYPLDRVPSREDRDFFRRLNQLFYEEMPTRVQDEFHYHVDIISRLLDRELGVFGVYIGKYNAKILPDLDARRLTLLVTDLAVYLERLTLPDSGLTAEDSYDLKTG
ncbi:MAG TPA: hypothetical protein VF508_00405 [Pyrinomonadaceae bacterium]|jgi:hypothetical protein